VVKCLSEREKAHFGFKVFGLQISDVWLISLASADKNKLFFP